MSSERFPSGPWIGFYTYHGRPQKFPMDLLLEFKNGIISGEGHDAVGGFVIAGLYSAENHECSWQKTYVGRHTVDYRGFAEGKGIWGTWILTRFKGGFHIWPLSEGQPLTATAEKDSSERPETAPLIADHSNELRPQPPATLPPCFLKPSTSNLKPHLPLCAISAQFVKRNRGFCGNVCLNINDGTFQTTGLDSAAGHCRSRGLVGLVGKRPSAHHH